MKLVRLMVLGFNGLELTSKLPLPLGIGGIGVSGAAFPLSLHSNFYQIGLPLSR